MRRRNILSIAAFLILAGCFISTGDLIKPADADYPVADGTHFAIYSLLADGTRAGNTPDKAVVTRKDGFYVMTMTESPNKTGLEGNVMTGLMKAFETGLYAVMVQDPEKPGHNLYMLARKDGARWLRWDLVCPDFVNLAEENGVTVASMGVTIVSSDCEVKDFASLTKAMRFVHENKKPDWEYVVE
ncbi:MAG: hypothetical protein CVT73_05200 [Alphaproteobacteria bacterium HGW-Alphaproteobacteria-12]|nr:MAG: hypothetical protein CVT73_05200 [Alphaproteobacteria bacterium HGW-Alphaproteobacteria-12]